MNIKEIINIYQKMQADGVVLYGGGKEGRLAIEVLEKEGIEVKAIADRERKKQCGCYQCISLEELCRFERNAVCIITPVAPLTEVREELSKHYGLVIDNSIVHWMSYFVPKKENGDLNYYWCFPFNHYESPFASEQELKKYDLENQNDALLGIHLNSERQEEMLPSILQYGLEFINRQSERGFRYRAENTYYNLTDAAVLHSMIRQFAPKKMIEIGSGFSTCVMLDTNEEWLSHSASITCIEPDPGRLLSNIKGKEDQIILIPEFVQNVPLDEFESLEENDMLFIDSSHVTKACGDVPYEYFQIFPRLKKGVIIHIHDIFFPFTYPLEWLRKGRSYTEAFLLRALLMNNDQYEILFFNHMMNEKLNNNFAQYGLWIPEGTSIYLRKK